MKSTPESPDEKSPLPPKVAGSESTPPGPLTLKSPPGAKGDVTAAAEIKIAD